MDEMKSSGFDISAMVDQDFYFFHDDFIIVMEGYVLHCDYTNEWYTKPELGAYILTPNQHNEWLPLRFIGPNYIHVHEIEPEDEEEVQKYIKSINGKLLIGFR